MKWKFYLWTFATALAALAVTSGCSSSDDPDDPIPPPTPTDQYSFSVSVSDVKANSALVTVTPDAKSTQATWYCSVVDKATFDKFADDKAYLADDLAYLKKQAENEKLTLENYLKAKIETGTKAVPFTLLDPSTDYYAYVYGITAAGVVTSPLAKYAFKTEAGSVDPAQLTFEFEVSNITKTAADLDVTPSNDDDTYFFNFAPVTAFDGKTDEEFIALVTKDLTEDLLSKGPDGMPAELIQEYAPMTPGTEYYVYAFGYDMQKGATTGVSKEKFTTEEATGPVPEVTVTVAQGDQDGANKATNLTFTACSPEAVSGLFVTGAKSNVDALLAQGYTLDQIVSSNGKAFTEAQLAKLNAEAGLPITFIDLNPETTYTFLIKTVGSGGRSVVKSLEGTTAAISVQPSDMTFTLSASEITATSALVTVTPDKLDETYFFDIQKKSIVDSYEGNLTELIEAFDAAYADNGGVAGMLSKGEEKYRSQSMSPNTSYYLLAFGYSDGVATTALSTYEFKTESAATSDLTFTIAVDETQPVPGGVTATITPSNNDETYLVAFTLADEIDALESDAEIIAYYEEMYSGFILYLTYSGVYETMPTDFGGELAMMPGADYYIVAFGYGEEGATTDVFKTRIKAGAGPDPVGTAFSFEVENLTDTEASLTANASKEPVIYMWDVLSEADYAELGGTPAGISAYIADEFEYYSAAFTPRQVIAGLGAWYSGATYDYNSLNPATVYIPYAVCVDVEGNVVDTPVLGESFTTEAAAGGASVPKLFGRYDFGHDFAPKILRPMRGVSARPQVDALLRRRAAHVGTAAPKSAVRGLGLRAAVRVEGIETMARQQLEVSGSAALSSVRSAVQLPRRSAVRTPRR